MFSDMSMPSAKTVVSTAASIAATAMVIRSITRDIIPYEFQSYIFSSIRGYLKSFSSDVILIIEEYEGFLTNQIYKAAEIYLGTKVSPSTQMFKVSMPEKESKISTFMAKNQEILDIFHGVQFKWRQITRMVENKRGQSSSSTEVRYFELRFHKKHKEMVFDTYFPFILKESKSLKEEKKTLKIYTLINGMHRYAGQDAWSSINLDHPATFDTLAMDLEPKRMIMEDLERFVKRKEYYRGVGKAWKRGYLLYGPPGTGKSSLIAAMANYLKFDIYDLELTDLHANSVLRRLLIATGNRSIIVVEDIDCSLDLDDRQAEARVLNALRSKQVCQAQTVNIIHENKPKVSF